jgi:hypothetical protein
MLDLPGDIGMGGELAGPPREAACEQPMEPRRDRELTLGVLIGDGPGSAHGAGAPPACPEFLERLLHPQPFTTWVRYVLIPVSGGDPLMA